MTERSTTRPAPPPRPAEPPERKERSRARRRSTSGSVMIAGLAIAMIAVGLLSILGEDGVGTPDPPELRSEPSCRGVDADCLGKTLPVAIEMFLYLFGCIIIPGTLGTFVLMVIFGGEDRE